MTIIVELKNDVAPHGEVMLSVIDTGSGISKHDQKKLFRMFGFLDKSKDVNTKGIGLGLHICKLITQQFGGSVNVKSSPGRGSEFNFSFKLELKAAEENGVRRKVNPFSQCDPTKLALAQETYES